MATEHERTMITVGLVNRYMTPFAALLVLSAALLSRAPAKGSIVAVVILLATYAMNHITHRLVARAPERMTAIRNARVVVNYVCDLAIIYIFLPYWPAIWMLFLLTIIAVGAYEEKAVVVQHALLLTAMLAAVSYLRGRGVLAALGPGLYWGDVAIRAAALWFAGLFVNGLVVSIQDRS